MTDKLLNAFKMHAGAMDSGLGRTRIGVVTSVNPDNHTAKVMLQPDGVLTSWLPVRVAQAGVAVLPPVGKQVTVEAQEGDGEHGIVTGIIYSDLDLPPKTQGAYGQAGEFLVVIGGASLYLNNGGSVIARDSSGAVLTLAQGTVTARDAAGSVLALTNDGNAKLTVSGIYEIDCGNFNVSATEGISLETPVVAASTEITVGGTVVVVP